MDLPDHPNNAEEQSQAELIAELRQELLKKSTEYSSLQLYIRHEVQAKCALEEKIAVLNSEKGNLGHKIGLLRKENTVAEDLLAQNHAMIVGLQKKITALNNELSQGKGKLSHVQNDKNVSNILKDLIKHDARVGGFDKKINQLKKELLQLEQEHEANMLEEKIRFNKETGRLGRIIGNLRNGFDSSD